MWGLDSSGSEYGPVADSYEHRNDRSGSTKGAEILDQLSESLLVKKVSAPCS
jgi:hypothetical protein